MRTFRVVLLMWALLCAGQAPAQFISLGEAAARHPTLNWRFTNLFNDYTAKGILKLPPNYDVIKFADEVSHAWEHYGEGSFDNTMLRRPLYYLAAMKHLAPFRIESNRQDGIALFISSLVSVIHQEGFRNANLFSLENQDLMVSPLQILQYATSVEGINSALGGFVLRVQTRCNPTPCEIVLDPAQMQFKQLKSAKVKVHSLVEFRFHEDRNNDAWLRQIKEMLEPTYSRIRIAELEPYVQEMLRFSNRFQDFCGASDLKPLFITVNGLELEGKVLKLPVSGRLDSLALIPRSQKMLHIAPTFLVLKGKYSWAVPAEIALSRSL